MRRGSDGKREGAKAGAGVPTQWADLGAAGDSGGGEFSFRFGSPSGAGASKWQAASSIRPLTACRISHFR